MAQQRVEFFDDRDDAVLLAAARAGDAQSADVLWIRVRPAALAVARRITRNSHDAEDLASEALSKVFAAISDGHGPSESLLPYVSQTMRNLHISTLRRQARSGPVVELDEEHDLDLVTVEPDALESEIVTAAFKNLPERWRNVLWASLVEGRDGGEIATQLGIKPAAVHALKARALEGLRQRYLTQHAQAGLPQDCADVHRELAAVARGKVRPSTDVSEVWRHLRGCEHCAEGYREISAMNNRIGALVGPAAAAGMAGLLPQHPFLSSLSTLRASTSLAKMGVAAGFTGVVALSVAAATLLPSSGHEAPQQAATSLSGSKVAPAADQSAAGAAEPRATSAEATPVHRSPTPCAGAPALPGVVPPLDVAGAIGTALPTALPTAPVPAAPIMPTSPCPVPSDLSTSTGAVGGSPLDVLGVKPAVPAAPALPTVTLPPPPDVDLDALPVNPLTVVPVP